MSLYLELAAGPYHFLVAGRQVEKVQTQDEQPDRKVDIRELFGAPSQSRGTRIRLMDGDGAVVLVVDRVVGLRSIAPHEFRPFPSGSTLARHHFDAVHLVDGEAVPRWRGGERTQ